MSPGSTARLSQAPADFNPASAFTPRPLPAHPRPALADAMLQMVSAVTAPAPLRSTAQRSLHALGPHRPILVPVAPTRSAAADASTAVPCSPPSLPCGRSALQHPGAAVHTGAGLHAAAVVRPGVPGHFTGEHHAAGAMQAASRAQARSAVDLPRQRTRASAQAAAGLGWVELSADCRTPADSLLPAAVAGGGWMDRLTVNATGLEGEPGELSVALQLHALLRSDANGTAATRLILGCWVDGVPVPLLPSPCWGGRPGAGQARLDQALASLVLARLPIVFGRSFELAVFALVRAGSEPALAPPPCLPGSSIGHSSASTTGPGLRWAGLRGVTTASRSRRLMHFKQYTLASQTGVDWRLPVPAETAACETTTFPQP